MWNSTSISEIKHSSYMSSLFSGQRETTEVIIETPELCDINYQICFDPDWDLKNVSYFPVNKETSQETFNLICHL